MDRALAEVSRTAADADALHDRSAALASRLAGHALSKAPAGLDADGQPLWSADTPQLPLSRCRADSAYVWQSRGETAAYGASLLRAYPLVRSRVLATGRDLLGVEDGACGAETARAADGRLLSRDLLDSASELCFLQEQLGVAEWSPSVALDIGCGYGRFAHRCRAALPRLRVLSTDALAGSLATAEAHLEHRGLAAQAADVLPPDGALDAALDACERAGTPLRLAVAIHALPEMSAESRRWWLALLAARKVPYLFVVSNATALHGRDATFCAHADDGAPLEPELSEAGYVLRRAAAKYERAPPASDGELPHADCTFCLFELSERLADAPRQPAAAAAPRGIARCINLLRRPDRRQWMEVSALLPLRQIGVDARILAATDASPEGRGGASLEGRVSAEADAEAARWQLDAAGLAALGARMAALDFVPLQAEELALYHGRPVSTAELACLDSHRRAWAEVADADFLLCLEDDVTPFADGRPRGARQYSQAWARAWLTLSQEVARLAAWGEGWDLIYLGRNALGRDHAAVGAAVVECGFSSCGHAYAVSRRGAAKLLALPRDACLPVDELLPALYSEHPRADVRCWAQRNSPAGGFRALAFRRELLHQLESVATGDASEAVTDPTALAGLAGSGLTCAALSGAALVGGAITASASELSLSDVRPRRRRRGGRGQHRPAADALLPGIFEHSFPSADLPRWQHAARPLLPASTTAAARRSGVAGAARAPWSDLPAWAWLWAASSGGPRLAAALRCVAAGMSSLLGDEGVWRCFYLRRCHVLALSAQHLAEVEPHVDFAISWQASCMRAFGDATTCRPTPLPRDRSAAPPALDLPRSLPPSLRRVPSAEASSLPPPRFRREYAAAGTPVLLHFGVGGLVGDAARWGLSGLLEEFAPRSFPVVDQGAIHGPARCHMRLIDYAAYMESKAKHAGTEDEPLYLFDHDPPPELVADFTTPAHFASDLLDDAAALAASRVASAADGEAGGLGLLGERRWLVVGPAMSGCRWHNDPFGTSAWNACLAGTKLWCLMRPKEGAMPPGVSETEWSPRRGGHVASPPAAAWFADWCRADADAGELLWAEQAAGDVLFVPRGWWHCTLNVDTSVAFTQNVVLPSGAATALRELSAAPGQERAAALLREVLHERHDDR